MEQIGAKSEGRGTTSHTCTTRCGSIHGREVSPKKGSRVQAATMTTDADATQGPTGRGENQASKWSLDPPESIED